ncbi:MFS transporter [Streptomyces sp. NPDC006733]|uniref:MFS transporter n=1 Tax=Streptomyces sp. NPDC006733 TaxID=3155460 RepID=UPI0033C59DF5
MAAARPGLVVFLAAKAASDIGYALDFVCLSVFVWERTGSALATGLVSVALYAGAILGGQAGSRYGRAWNRRGVMIGADAVRMAVLVVLAVLPAGAQLAWLYPVVFFLGVGRSVFEATLSAATPVLAGPRVQTVNSVLAGLKGIAFVVGMGAATVVVPVLGYRGVFGLDAGTYALSGLVLCALRLPLREAAPGPVPADAAAGAGLPAANPGPVVRGSGRPTWPLLVLTAVAPLVVLRGFDAFGSASQQVGLPILGSRLRPDAPELFAGTMWSVWAVGLFLAGFVLRPLATQLVARAPAQVFCLSTIVMSLGFIGVFWLPGWWPRLLAALVAGVGDAFSEITFKQALQQLPDEERGQAFGFCQIVVNGGLMAGLAVTSVVLTPDLAARWVLLLHGLPILLAGWLVLTAQRPRRVREQPQEQEQPT